jgi:colanic acid/amylovoran biosynthesis glycosyltransferase
LRLIYVTSSLPFGPGEAFVIPEIVELMRRGHTVTIVPTYPRGPVLHGDAARLLESTEAAPLLSAAIVRDTVLELVRSPLRVLRAWALIRSSRSFRILGKNLAVLAKGVWLARLARRRRAEHLHAHWGAASSSLALVASEVAGVPWSLTVHRWDIDEDNLLALKVRRACFVRTINSIGLEKVEARVGERPSAAFVLHVGVDLPASPEPREGPAASRILVPASLREVKGHTYLLEALALLRERGVEASADLIGDGPLRSSLELRTAELGLDGHVRFAGAVSHEALLEGLERGDWDVALLASVVTRTGEHEGIPVSLLEAMSFGLPVIGTRTGGIPDLLEGGAGLLVPERDAAALADSIERLLGDAALRAELATAGRRRVEERFAVQAVVSELEQRFAACA